ncbi:M56 family metallopeptidase [Spirosoma foliorum]|uniref:M48 family metalloprotease n=1 Tax=Spirosoma foliorum TaxID=2710596 RepID=A0A7G5GU71_9BACT|nr:M56 family metallopeptidase [Spirosoma foliorum]QMW02413.1 M48 family metalloprotease [Spirosoma foliorum]
MNAFHFLSNSVVDALGWTLLHALWQGFALVLPVAVVLHLLRNQSSMLRYRVSVLTLLTQLLVSGATFIWYYEPVVENQPIVPSAAIHYAKLVRWQTVTQSLPWQQQTQLFLERHLSQFVLIYLIGVALFGLRLAGGWLYLQRLSKTATQPATKNWLSLTNQLRSALMIKTVVQVRESARIAVPMVVGMLKPVLLLPIGLATSLSMREVEAVLAHELAHVKRHDYAVNLLQSVVEVLYFFHPALWWLSARVREEREHCCDDLAVEACGGNGRILAQALARVEELRLMQLEQTPALAMAFASKRQHLLHRVRRVLGVPTRPFVSNASLAGLTLATILLMSVSVYAVQKQDDTKKETKQPKPAQSTRRHKIDGNSEYGMVDGKKVGYVIWKGQKLSAARLTKLQTQLNQVMNGQLSLDAVKQADRDILLTIIEKNQAFDNGMGALTEGLSHIDYDNIVASSALKNVPLSPDGTVEGLAKVDYKSIIDDALAAATRNSHDAFLLANDTLAPQRAFQQRQIDSLSRLMNERAHQVQTLHLQMEKMQFPIEEFGRNQQMLEWRKEKLMQLRNSLIEKQQQMMRQDGKQKLSLEEMEKQVAAFEPEIKKQEASIEEANRQLEATQAKLLEARKPLEKLELESRQLDAQLERLSVEMERHGESLSRITSDLPNLDMGMNVNVNTGRGRITRTPRAPRAPRPAIAPRVDVVVPAVPAAPAVRVQAAPAIAPPTPPARVAKPRSAPKPAVAPKIDE